MTPPRRVPSPHLSCLQRSSLDPGYHYVVDAVLKQLKACSRRLQTTLDSHRTELQVLERLYYKGKNQHRTALFWQRVAELRKFGERVDEMRMEEVVENLRLSFWGEPSARTKKVLKGPWTHYPDPKFLLFALERCSACCTLIDKAQERSLRAYEPLTLMMQTGAFLQLILALAAIASRTNILLSEVKAALEISWSANYQALQALHPSDVQKVRKLLQTSEGNISSSSAEPSATTSRPASKPPPSETLDEDLGVVFNRATPKHALDEISATPKSASSAAVTLHATDEEERLDVTAFSLSSELESSHNRRESSAANPTVPASIPTVASVPTAAKRKKDKDEAGPTKMVKKRRKRDEIDDIFGF
uniref:Cell surface hydrophobicity-associated protein n=1 Tax=Ganoderma boninense TaxID=34458 RepID=A0A5K1K0Y4_9APHY